MVKMNTKIRNQSKFENTLSAMNTNHTQCTKPSTFKDKLKKTHYSKPEHQKQPRAIQLIIEDTENEYLLLQDNNSNDDVLFQNEIPGGFENVQDLSTNIENEASSCYVAQEDLQLKPYVGLDWEDIHVDSDSEFNNCPEFNTPMMLKCHECGHKFNNLVELNSHQLGHYHEDIFKCQHEGCDKNYPKASMLASHIKHRHNSLSII